LKSEDLANTESISANPCRFAALSGNLLPLSVNLPTQSGKVKLAHLLLHTLHSLQQF
jgi:hypothetical protein